MVKTIAAGCTVLLTALALWACNDKIDVKQAYPFRLTSWHLPEEIAEGENVEIRLRSPSSCSTGTDFRPIC